jgi:hypothetical protein
MGRARMILWPSATSSWQRSATVTVSSRLLLHRQSRGAAFLSDILLCGVVPYGVLLCGVHLYGDGAICGVSLCSILLYNFFSTTSFFEHCKPFTTIQLALHRIVSHTSSHGRPHSPPYAPGCRDLRTEVSQVSVGHMIRDSFDRQSASAPIF